MSHFIFLHSNTILPKIPSISRLPQNQLASNTKTIANATDNAVKKAIKQIQDAPGGIILDYGENEISDTILGVIKRRIERSRLTSVDVMLLQDGKLVSVLRHKK